jgi:hypothetical protein
MPTFHFVSESHDFSCRSVRLLTPVEAMLGAAINDRALQVQAAIALAADAALRHENLMGPNRRSWQP